MRNGDNVWTALKSSPLITSGWHGLLFALAVFDFLVLLSSAVAIVLCLAGANLVYWDVLESKLGFWFMMLIGVSMLVGCLGCTALSLHRLLNMLRRVIFLGGWVPYGFCFVPVWFIAWEIVMLLTNNPFTVLSTPSLFALGLTTVLGGVLAHRVINWITRRAVQALGRR